MVASRKLTEDPRAEAEYGERVPYVITNGEGSRLVDRAMAPEELLNNRYVGCCQAARAHDSCFTSP